jgi:hypothetical protein
VSKIRSPKNQPTSGRGMRLRIVQMRSLSDRPALAPPARSTPS